MVWHDKFNLPASVFLSHDYKLYDCLYSFDYLYIYDGPNTLSPILFGIDGTYGILSGKVIGTGDATHPDGVVLISSKRDVFVRFKTDGDDNKPGFQMKYEQGKCIYFF